MLVLDTPKILQFRTGNRDSFNHIEARPRTQMRNAAMAYRGDIAANTARLSSPAAIETWARYPR
jgi:hypothetical protein